MNKQDVTRALQKYGTFLSVTDTANALGVKRDTARALFLDGLDYITVGRKKLYLASDVAEKVMQRRING